MLSYIERRCMFHNIIHILGWMTFISIILFILLLAIRDILIYDLLHPRHKKSKENEILRKEK